MLVRYALFEGQIHSGRESEFRRFVEDRLVPLWTRFPGAENVSVQFGLERDEGAPVLAMILAITYEDKAALERALQSAVRAESREATAELLQMFTGRVHHHVFNPHDYPPGPR